jgi:2-polyprenyl-3-methyl-5-hydroxy-6-metoxy-1,4-benzoquinol methylase
VPQDPKHRDYYEANRASWDEQTAIHLESQAYSRSRFLRNERPLAPVNLAEIGSLVAGKRLLHLQCHFGMDTLNWARLGAVVTGIDFSRASIEAAQQLAADVASPGGSSRQTCTTRRRR